MANQPQSKLRQAIAPTAERMKEMTPYERFRSQLNLVRTDVSGLVGEKNVDRFVRVCLNAVQSNPATLAADRRTLLLACMKAAQDGLLPDGREAVFNVYNTKDREKSRQEGRDVWVSSVQYLPMAYGLIQKIYEAGATYVDAVSVYDRDEFDYQRGDDPKIFHRPYDGDEDPGKVKAAYVIVKLKTGETKREVMWRREIERVRQKSKAPDGMMWKEFYDQGAVKSVIHRVVKQLPRSEALERTLSHDNEATGLEEIPAVPAEATVTNLDALVDGRIEQRERTIEGSTEKVAGEAQPVGAAEPAAEGDAKPREEAKVREGEAGTPELKAKLIASFASSTDSEILSIKRDEANFYKWSGKDLGEIDAAYRKRLDELENPGE